MSACYSYNLAYASPVAYGMPFLSVMPSPSPQPSGVTVGQVVKDVTTAKERSGCRPCYTTGLRQYLNAFVKGREDKPLASFTTVDIEQWFQERGEKPNVEASNRGRLKALFSYGKRRKYITESPMDFLEPLRWQRGTPQILTIEQTKACLRFARDNPRFRATLVLLLLAGIRPDESSRISWRSVDVDRAIIQIDGEASKVRRRRVVELQPLAVTWLRTCPGWLARCEFDSVDAGVDDLPLVDVTRIRYMRKMRGALGLSEWPQDVLRHTCISMMLSKVKDLGRVAMSMGNSADIILTNYMQLVSESTANEFWSLTPDKV